MMKLLRHNYMMYMIPVLLSYIPYARAQSPNEILDSSFMTLERFTVTLQNLEKISLSVRDQLTTLTSDVATVSEKVEGIRIELKELKMKQDSQFKDIVVSIKQGQSNNTQAFSAVKSDTIIMHQKLQKMISEMSEAKVEEMKMLESIGSKMNIIQIMQNEQMTVDDENFQTLRLEQKDMLCSLNITLNELTLTQTELENATTELRSTEEYLCSELGNISAHIKDLKTLEYQETIKILTDIRNLTNLQLRQFPVIVSAINDTKEDHAKELSSLDSKVEEVIKEHKRGFGMINSRISDLNEAQSVNFGKFFSDFNELDTLATQQMREARNGFNNVLSRQNENLHIIMANLTDLKEAHSLQETAVLNSVSQLQTSQTNQFADVISDLHKMTVTHSNQLDHVRRSLADMEVQQGTVLSTITHDIQSLLNVTTPPAGPTVTETTPAVPDVMPMACVQATGSLDQLPSSCAQVQERGETRSGKYVIVLQYSSRPHPVLAYCDLQTNGGGWTVFQKRGNNGNHNDFFYKSWSNYVEGFGHPDKDFWLGLKYIYALSNQEPVSLRFDLWDWEGEHRYAASRTFKLTNREKFTIMWEGYSGNAGNSLPRSNNHFTTFDKDQDLLQRGNCAQKHRGAWWYSNCHKSNLNGWYNSTAFGTGVNWFDWHGIFYSLKETEIKLRPRDFQIN